MYILNGRTLGDLQGKPTCFSPKGKSVVDYFICSQNIMPKIIKFHVNNLTVFSDHCPIELLVHLPHQANSLTQHMPKDYDSKHKNKNRSNKKITENTKPCYSFKWDDDSAEKLLSAMGTSAISHQIADINSSVIACSGNNEHNKVQIENAVTELTNTVFYAAKLTVKYKTKGGKRKNYKPGKKWFTQECRTQRKEVRSLLNALNRHPFRKDIQSKYFTALKTFNCLVKRVKTEYKSKLVSSLNSAMENDPKEV